MVQNYVSVSYGISRWIQHLERQNPKKAPKDSVPEIKDRQYLQIIWEGKAKWYEIMSVFPTELAADTTLRTSEPQKSTKRYSVPGTKDRQYLQLI